MLNRIAEMFIVTMWLVSMAWLVARDAVPRWFAEAPPQVASRAWLADQGTEFQYAIYDHNGLRCGSCWSIYKVNDEGMVQKDLLVLENLSFAVEHLAIESELTFLDDTGLATIDIELKGVQAPIRLYGERQGPKFGFELRIARRSVHDFVLEASAAQTLCDLIKPFSPMQGLEVGRSWKIQVIDPFSLLQGNLRAKLQPMVVRVTGRETIQIEGRPRDCLLVEAQGARAWVDSAGRVLRQVVDVPGIGQLEIQEETFRQDMYDAMKRRIRSEWR